MKLCSLFITSHIYCTLCKVKVNYDASKNPRGVKHHMEHFHGNLLAENEVEINVKKEKKQRWKWSTSSQGSLLQMHLRLPVLQTKNCHNHALDVD